MGMILTYNNNGIVLNVNDNLIIGNEMCIIKGFYGPSNNTYISYNLENEGLKYELIEEFIQKYNMYFNTITNIPTSIGGCNCGCEEHN